MNAVPPGSSLSPREIEVCERLRAFREASKISRAGFAAGLGIGTERLASYESARAPLRWDVFTKIHERWHINPHWLATGSGFAFVLDFNLDRWVKVRVEPRKLFTEIYDEFIERSNRERAEILRRIKEDDWKRKSGQKQPKDFLEGLIERMSSELERMRKGERKMNEFLRKEGLRMDLDE